MTSREEAWKIAADAAERFHTDDGLLFKRIFWERVASVMVDALIAAGVIPAEGTTTVDAKQWEDTSDLADALCQWVDGVRYSKREGEAEQLTADGMLSWDDLSYAVDEFRASYVDVGDLDAIPAAPTGEGDRTITIEEMNAMNEHNSYWNDNRDAFEGDNGKDDEITEESK